MTDVLVPIVVFTPSVFFGVLFVRSYLKEPRQFRNAIWFLLFIISLSLTLLLYFGQHWTVVLLAVIAAIAPFIVIALLLVNAVIVVRREGVSIQTLLPGLLALTILAYLLLYPALFMMEAPAWAIALGTLVMAQGVWFFFSFAALLLYSWLYQALPRRRRYDFIVVHGAGLQGDEPTPLLRGRLDKAYELWDRQGRRAIIIVSGGRGSDEIVSEAAAMRGYLVNKRGVPESAIMDEDRSTSTMENVINSKAMMDAHWTKMRAGHPYRAALVTSDFHVFRACEYARNTGLNADGVASHTRGYYWPAAFIREFVAISRSHMWPYYVIAILWALAIVAVAIHA